MFQYASGVPDATPSATDAAPFVFAMRAAFGVCVALTAVAFVASFMRGSR
jgi:hypothetical protein